MSATSTSPAQDLVSYLTSKGVSPIFVNYLPDSPDDVTGVYDTGGRLPSLAMGAVAGRTVIEEPTVQVQCRDADGKSAQAAAYAIWKLLSGMPAGTINGNDYLHCEAMSSVGFAGRDGLGRRNFTCSYRLVKRPS